MFERTTKLQIEKIIQKEFCYIQDQEFIALEDFLDIHNKKLDSKKTKDKINNGCEVHPHNSTNETNMTRKTRTRRPRIQAALQSGYCAVCHIPYNSVEDHIQSKKHQKLIGEDANYISLNGFIHQDANIESFLNLNGIDAIGVNGSVLDREYSPKPRRRNMPRTRANSVMCEKIKPSPMSPTGSEIIGHHHLRSRKNINYMTPPLLDEDSLPEKSDNDIDSDPEIEPAKEFRELRSSTRILAKLTEQLSSVENDECWNSGRPKRSCIKQKRISADERLVTDNKTYYKVEVLSNKLRSSSTNKESEVSKQLQSPTREEEKGLIVKFKKLRSSELVRLNSEAENFLFPKKDDSSEDEDIDDNAANTTASSGRADSTLLLSSEEEDARSSEKFKVEDEGSMDSNYSDCKRKKRRRLTQAEAFIMDNQKYYKFETPGSSSCRLRYHGSYLPPVGMKSPKSNGDCAVKVEKEKEKIDDFCPDESDSEKSFKLNLNDYQFSFERVPKNEVWYNIFQRQDRGEAKYNYFNDTYWDSFVLPYQMGPIPPLDPKVCIHQYQQIMKCLQEPPSTSTSVGCSTPDPSASNSTGSFEAPDTNDEDSKFSAVSTISSTSTLDDLKTVERRRPGRRRRVVLTPGTVSKNPRKSPRQHASTLAILSSFIQQRKRRPRVTETVQSKKPLPTIPEVVVPKRSPGRPPRINYTLIARNIEEELNSTLEEIIEDDHLEVETEHAVDFHHSKVDVKEIMKMYEDNKKVEDIRTTRRFFNGTPGRKPGRKKKKNRTGWPNRNRRLAKKDQSKQVDEDDSTVDSLSVNNDDSDDEEVLEETNSTDSINNKRTSINNKRCSVNKLGHNDVNSKVEENCDLNSDRVDKVLTNKVTNSGVNNALHFQPYVCVQKLDSDSVVEKGVKRVRENSPKRTSKSRRLPPSPKSPRMLRKPRGRWYRER